MLYVGVRRMNFFDANFLTVGLRKLLRVGRRRRGETAAHQPGEEAKDERFE